MTKPTPKPTVASLQRELAAMSKQYETAKRNKDWLGPVAGNYRRLKKFVEGGNG